MKSRRVSDLIRKVNGLLVVLSIIGGFLGYLIGEWLLSSYFDTMPRILLVALYFGILAFFIGVMCLLAEWIHPRLCGSFWREKYVGSSLKMLIPATLILLFLVALILETLYELNIKRPDPVEDVVLAIDVSGSMLETDPTNERFKAAKSLVDMMKDGQRVGIVVFDHVAFTALPLTSLVNPADRQKVHNLIDTLRTQEGGTDIGAALAESIQQVDAKRKAMVILLSDGFSEFDMLTSTQSYRDQQVLVSSIGMSFFDIEGAALLKQISDRTGGIYVDVQDVTQFSSAFATIYKMMDNRTLITDRSGFAKESWVYGLMRVFSLLLIGGAIGLSLGLIFDNRYLAISFASGGIAGGLLAGLLLEAGFHANPMAGESYRLGASLLLAFVISIFTLIVPIHESGAMLNRRSQYAPDLNSGGTSRYSDDQSIRKSFKG
jgi:Ca-activated chloride channel family protein